MAATIKIKNSSTTGSVPSASNLVQGELAVNVTDLGLYTENASGTVVKLNAPSIDDKNTGATKYLTIDTSGNLGLGVTPSAWASSNKAIQVASRSALAQTASFETIVGNNWYYDTGGTNKYLATAASSLYLQGGGAHAWLNAASGTAGNAISFTQAMTLDASGNLGLGTTSPTDTSGYGRVLDIRGSTTSNGGVIYLRNSDATVTGQLAVYGDGRMDIGTTTAHPLKFFTTNSERARIDSSGNLLVGTTSLLSGGERLAVLSTTSDWNTVLRNSHASGPYGVLLQYTGAAPNGTTNSFVYASDSSALRFQVRSNGGIANYSGNNVNLSDRREKTNFATSGDYLAKICAIPVQTFNYIDQNMEEDSGLTLGVVAQDVQAVAPELVMESNWAKEGDEPKMRLSIYQTDLQYALMKCIQEQQAIITALTARIEALEA